LGLDIGRIRLVSSDRQTLSLEIVLERAKGNEVRQNLASN